MATFLEHKNIVIKLLNDSAAFAQKAEYLMSAENIQQIKERLLKKELVVVVCGEVKRGKSSLLSAFLEERDLFPVDVNVTTNTVTIVRYGETEKIEAVFETDAGFETQQISRAEIAHYVTEQGNKYNEKKVNCLSIEIPNNKLKEGLVFVDTPGVGSLNLAHSEVAYGYLPNADILIFVSDALAPLTAPELKFLQSATRYCKNVIYPLTKIDKTSDYMAISQENLEKISKATATPKEEIKIVPVSNLAKLKYLDSHNAMHLKSSKYQDLENEIWKMIYEKRAEIILYPPLTELGYEIETVRNGLKIKYQSLTGDDSVSAKLQEELKKALSEKQSLMEDGAEWRVHLSHELSVIQSEVVSEIQRQFSEVEDFVIEASEIKGMGKNLNELNLEVNGMIGRIALDANDYIYEKVYDLALETENKLGLSISVNEGMIGISVPTGEVPIKKPDLSRSDKIVNLGRSTAITSSAGGALGGVICGALGATIGFFVAGPGGAILGAKAGVTLGAAGGAVAGSTKGLRDGIEVMNTATAPQIRQNYAQYVNRKHRELISSANIAMKNLTYSLTTELGNKIKNQRAILDKNISDSQESIKLSKIDAAKAANDMKPLFDTINVIATRINQLMSISTYTGGPSDVQQGTAPVNSSFASNPAGKDSEPKNGEQTSGQVSLEFCQD